MATKKEIIGFFPGVWDLLHPGHIRALKEAKSKCDFLIVGINAFPRNGNPKKNKPILTWEERQEIIKELKCVDETLVYRDDEILYFLDKGNYFGINIRFLGADHKGKKHHFIKAKIVYISRNHNYSSSELRKRILNA